MFFEFYSWISISKNAFFERGHLRSNISQALDVVRGVKCRGSRKKKKNCYCHFQVPKKNNSKLFQNAIKINSKSCKSLFFYKTERRLKKWKEFSKFKAKYSNFKKQKSAYLQKTDAAFLTQLRSIWIEDSAKYLVDTWCSNFFLKVHWRSESLH